MGFAQEIQTESAIILFAFVDYVFNYYIQSDTTKKAESETEFQKKKTMFCNIFFLFFIFNILIVHINVIEDVVNILSCLVSGPRAEVNVIYCSICILNDYNNNNYFDIYVHIES